MTRGTIGFCLSRIIRGEKKKKNWESTLIIPHWVKYLRLDKSFYPRECANVLKQLEQDLRSMRSQPTEIGWASWGEIDAGLYKDHLGILDSSFSKINILFHFAGMGGVGWFPVCSDGKKSACNSGDLDSIPGSGRFPEEGNGYPLQYSCLKNPMDRGAWQTTAHGVIKSWTWLND